MCCIRVIGAIGSLAALALPAYAGSGGSQAERDAAYLQEAFGHNLCARDDHELHKLNRALGKQSVTATNMTSHRR